MKSLSDCWSFLSRFRNLLFLLFIFSFCDTFAQGLSLEYRPSAISRFSHPSVSMQDTVRNAKDSFPDPYDVMYRSLFVPGWGQVTNRQIWKVPIVYGLLGGLTWYSIYLTKRYHDFRAAFYNLNPSTPDDQRFGPTPSYIPENVNLESLRSTRNSLRNRRDFIYISIGLAYGLNVIDAYVFAHMRSFDVSEDLSMRTRIQPSVMASGSPGVTITLQFHKN